MTKAERIVFKALGIAVTCFSVNSVLFLFLVLAIHYLPGLSYLYRSEDVVHRVYDFFAITILLFIVITILAILIFKARRVIKIICIALLMVLVMNVIFASFFAMRHFLVNVISPYGCSYTEDIANYGKYDIEYDIPYFPDSITDDMEVVKFSYFYKHSDGQHTDLYLEVKFKDEQIMQEYLKVATDAISELGYVSYPNPYNSKYTDIVMIRLFYSDKYLRSNIEFEEDAINKHVDMKYDSITFSYDDLTVIYNYTSLDHDTVINDNISMDDGAYYSKFLERFGVEWSPDNNFSYELNAE